MDSPKRLLIIGAGLEQAKAYTTAKDMGLEVAGSDMNPDAPAFEHADYRILASTRDAVATLSAVREFVKERPIHGVMTIANDVPLTVAAVAHDLGLAGIPLGAARIASDKLVMKDCFARTGVRVPEYREIKDPMELKRTARVWGFPLVVKPVDGRGARGVLLINREDEMEGAFEESLGFSQAKRLMAERFVHGAQISTESLILDGRAYTPAYSDRNYEFIERFYPYIIENGGTMPARLTDEERARINALIERAAGAMGITRGIVKGDVVMGKDGPAIIELAARLSGGYFATDQIPASTGVDLVAVAIRLALGQEVSPLDVEPRRARGAAIRFFFPPEGRVVGIDGADALGRMPGVIRCALYRRPGDVQVAMKAHPDRAGFVITEGNDRGEAEERALDAINSVSFIMA